MSGKRMSWLLCAAFLLALMVLPALAETDEIVLTFGGDCVLGTREQWKKKKKARKTGKNQNRTCTLFISALK